MVSWIPLPHRRVTAVSAFALSLALGLGALSRPSSADAPPALAPVPAELQEGAGRSLGFLESISAKWREVRKCVTYVLQTQRPDGSWEAISRQALGKGEPRKGNEVTVHWGTGWATLDLLSGLPKPPASAATTLH